MKFTVTRSSFDSDDKQPCEEALRLKLEKWDTRTCTEEDYNKKVGMGKTWREEGSDHEELSSRTGITRKIGYVNDFCVEINSLEELIAFYRKYGDLIITEHVWSHPEKGEPTIEIYDDYRE